VIISACSFTESNAQAKETGVDYAFTERSLESNVLVSRRAKPNRSQGDRYIAVADAAALRALMKTFELFLVGALLTISFPLLGDPVTIRHIQGYLSAFVVLKGTDGKILASGEATQLPAGNRITSVLTLHFRDGSLHEERAVFSQHRVFQLLTYKLTQRGPSFSAPETLSFDTASGNVIIETTDKNGKPKSISKQLSPAARSRQWHNPDASERHRSDRGNYPIDARLHPGAPRR
jgi:hypothetical protein